jgi:hypothetical protein
MTHSTKKEGTGKISNTSQEIPLKTVYPHKGESVWRKLQDSLIPQQFD